MKSNSNEGSGRPSDGGAKAWERDSKDSSAEEAVAFGVLEEDMVNGSVC